MRVGVYIDGFNLYFGAREHCGRGTSGWRWIDVRALVEAAIPPDWSNRGATVERVVYCTAKVNGIDDPTSPRDQDIYLRALKASGSVDHIEHGNFVRRVKTAPLAERGSKGGTPTLTTSKWPVMVQDAAGSAVFDARFLVSYLHREEKGSDVNVATHLLLDVFGQAVDAAIIVSNDSDLKLPVQRVRGQVSVGMLNPGAKPIAGGLKSAPGYGASGHWSRTLSATDYRTHQLADPVGKLRKPRAW